MLRRVGSSSKKDKVYELVESSPESQSDRKQMGPKPENGWTKKGPDLVAKGYSRVEGIDYLEIFSPVICYESICLMFHTGSTRKMVHYWSRCQNRIPLWEIK